MAAHRMAGRRGTGRPCLREGPRRATRHFGPGGDELLRVSGARCVGWPAGGGAPGVEVRASAWSFGGPPPSGTRPAPLSVRAMAHACPRSCPFLVLVGWHAAACAAQGGVDSAGPASGVQVGDGWIQNEAGSGRADREPGVTVVGAPVLRVGPAGLRWRPTFQRRIAGLMSDDERMKRFRNSGGCTTCSTGRCRPACAPGWSGTARRCGSGWSRAMCG